MLYCSWDMACDRCNHFFILGHFRRPFTPLTAQKNQDFTKMKKNPGDIIILHKWTKNHDHMLYCSWDMAHDICNCYFSFWDNFCSFTPQQPQKWKVQTNEEKLLEISSFYNGAPKIMIICYTVTEICRVTDVIVCFPFQTIFCPFTLLTAQKIKISSNVKKRPKNIIILHNFTKNHDHMLYCFWDIAHDKCNYFSFWANFCPLTRHPTPTPFPQPSPPSYLTAQKINIFK